MAQKIMASLDIGSHKIACIIAVQGDDGSMRSLGFAQKASQGITRGVIVDMNSAEEAIRSAVSAAEKTANMTIQDISVAVNAVGTEIEILEKSITVTGKVINKKDIERLINEVKNTARPDMSLIHAIPVHYILDENPPSLDPIGLVGEKLTIKIALVYAKHNALTNIVNLVKKCHLNCQNLVLSSYAAALGVMVEQELQMGSLLIDFGGGTTNIVVIRHGTPIFHKTINLGSANITKDIALGLSTPLDHAERLKTRFGSLLDEFGDTRDLEVLRIGEDGNTSPHRITRHFLNQILVPRVDEICDMVNNACVSAGFPIQTMQNIVITGGGAECSGLCDYLQALWGRPVRIGYNNSIKNLPDTANGPKFACLAGVLRYGTQLHRDVMPRNSTPTISTDKWSTRLWQWYKDNYN